MLFGDADRVFRGLLVRVGEGLAVLDGRWTGSEAFLEVLLAVSTDCELFLNLSDKRFFNR